MTKWETQSLRLVLPDGVIISKVEANRQNCLAEESKIFLSNGKVVQDIVLRLRNVESGGEVELQLQWIDVPRSSFPFFLFSPIFSFFLFLAK